MIEIAIECFDCSPELTPIPPPFTPPGPPPIIDSPLGDLLPMTGIDALIIGIIAGGIVVAGVIIVLIARWLWHLGERDMT